MCLHAHNHAFKASGRRAESAAKHAEMFSESANFGPKLHQVSAGEVFVRDVRDGGIILLRLALRLHPVPAKERVTASGA